MKLIHMIKTLFAGMSLLWLQSCASTDYGSFFEREEYREQSNLEVVKIPSFIIRPMLRSELAKEEDGAEVLAIIKKLKSFKMRTGKVNSSQAMVDFNNYLTRQHFDDWVVVKSKDKLVSIRAIQTGDLIKTLFITINTGGEVMLLDVKGNFTVQDITNLINQSDSKLLKKIK